MSVLVVAPHPDDETLGCGGTLARKDCEGAEVHGLIATDLYREAGFEESRITALDDESRSMERHVHFASVSRLRYLAASSDTLLRSEFVVCTAGVAAAEAFMSLREIE